MSFDTTFLQRLGQVPTWGFLHLCKKPHVVRLCHEADTFDHLRDLMLQRPQLWRIPARLIADVIVDDETFRDRDLWQLVEDLLPEDNMMSPDAVGWWLVWLCGRYVLEQQMDKREIKRESIRTIRNKLRTALIELVTTADALQSGDTVLQSERADCGRALGLLGDERQGIGLIKVGQGVGLPDMVWGKEVPPGQYTIGGDDEASNPLEKQEYPLKYPFKLAKYPVTMAQFQAFIDAPDGMQSDEWWHDIQAEKKSYEQYNPYPNHPREMVSWHEAVAFCRWLTAKHHDTGLLDKDWEIRLPTEVEWEIAARYPNAKRFPYGNEADTSKMNVSETGIGQSSAVGLFPLGKQAELDLYDMSGNVFEWTLTNWNDASNVIDSSGASRVIRGGSFLGILRYARAASRYHFILRGSLNGLRCCASPIFPLDSDL